MTYNTRYKIIGENVFLHGEHVATIDGTALMGIVEEFKQDLEIFDSRWAYCKSCEELLRSESLEGLLCNSCSEKNRGKDDTELKAPLDYIVDLNKALDSKPIPSYTNPRMIYLSSSLASNFSFSKAEDPKTWDSEENDPDR